MCSENPAFNQHKLIKEYLQGIAVGNQQPKILLHANEHSKMCSRDEDNLND